MSEHDNPYGVPTTGHVWDETLAELTNPPPKWWMIGLHVSWILVVVYGLLYPMWPWFGGATPGILHWTQIKEFKASLAELNTVRAKYEDQLKGLTADQILAKPELTNYVVRSARVLFGDNCAACHGASGQGTSADDGPGFPNLTDDDWLLGGSVDAIQNTITNGHMGMMPAKGGNPTMTTAEIDELANAIIKHEPTSSPLFTSKGCFACHGADGKGNQAIGSANLTDSIWRFRSKDQLASVKYTITHGVNDPSDPDTRHAQMPTFGGGKKLSKEEITKLAVYVYKFSH